MPEPYFVYVREDRHMWRFVFHAASARDGDDAIDQAQAEGRALGNDVDGLGYMAVPQSAITTRRGAHDQASF